MERNKNKIFLYLIISSFLLSRCITTKNNTLSPSSIHEIEISTDLAASEVENNSENATICLTIQESLSEENTAEFDVIEFDDLNTIVSYRKDEFENTLQLNITSITGELVSFQDSKEYEIELEAQLINISTRNIIIRKPSGISLFPGPVNLFIEMETQNGAEMFFASYSVSGGISYLPVKYTYKDLLQIAPGECLEFSYILSVPHVSLDKYGVYERISPGIYQVNLFYFNFIPGLFHIAENRDPNRDENQSYIIDLNVWVGDIESNKVELVLSNSHE